MRKKIVFLVFGVCAVVLVLILLRHRQESQLRVQLVSDYLKVIQPTAAFMIEVSGLSSITRPSAYTVETLLAQSLTFQKKYQRHGRLILHEHNRIEDFLASVDATVKNYVRLAQMEKNRDPDAWSKHLRGLHTLFFHNAVYCTMAVGRNKTSLAITKQQRVGLLRTIDIHYGGVIYPYISRPQRPAFIADLLIIRESLESRRPAIF